MVKSWTKISFGICITIGVFACKTNNQQFSKTPELFFRSFSATDSTIIWSIGFTDGDGDIGVRNDNDPDNFIVRGFKIENGVPVELSDPYDYRIPVVKNVVTTNGIEGEFKFTLEKAIFKAQLIDSLFLKGYVVDRSLKTSNEVQTPIFTTN